jgi:hypothetical protein
MLLRFNLQKKSVEVGWGKKERQSFYAGVTYERLLPRFVRDSNEPLHS